MANIAVETAWNSVAAVVLYLPFYFLVGMYNNGKATGTQYERGMQSFLLIWGLLVFEGTFAEMCVITGSTKSRSRGLRLRCCFLC